MFQSLPNAKFVKAETKPSIKGLAAGSFGSMPISYIFLTTISLTGRMPTPAATPTGIPYIIEYATNNLALSPARSEEHTSELQSRENLVCRLLLEKKKKCTQ